MVSKKVSEGLLKYYQTKDSFRPKVDVPWGKTKEQHRLYYARWRELNREDYNKRRKEWADKNRQKRTAQSRNSLLQRKYGLSLKEFNSMLVKQNYACAICCKKPVQRKDRMGRIDLNLRVDHCHKTFKVRGLLCHNCNSALGHFKDNVEILKNAIAYIDDKALNVEDVIIK